MARLAEALVWSALRDRMVLEEIQAGGRGVPAVAAARQQAFYLACIASDLSLTRLGAAFGRDRTTVSHACRRQEDRRGEPARDHGFSAAEAGLRCALAAFGPVQDKGEGA